MDGFTVAILRTTVCTVLGALVATHLLAKQRVDSPTVHRIVWTLVLLQGWVFFPIAFALPIGLASAVITSDEQLVAVASPMVPSAVLEVVADDAMVMEQRLSIVGRARWAAMLWAVGALAVAFHGLKRYTSLISKVPLGRQPTQAQWIAEWNRVVRDARVRTRTQFRLSDATGPLCCFVPFFYLILAPESLWLALKGKQREAILRHELAHVTRRDLWKSVAIRILALPQWFNPFAWKAVRAFDEAAEWACDDFVMGARNKAYRASYPSALLRIVESTLEPLPGSVAAQGGVLTTRIRRLVQPRIMEETRMKKMLIPALLCGLVLAQSIRIEAVEVDERPGGRSGAETAGQVPPDSSTSESPTAARKADLARTGLDPYRVAPPDIIVIHLESAEKRSIEASSRQSVIDGEHLVSPDGNIHVNDLGNIYVAGKTLEEIARDVNARLAKASDPRRVSVDVLIYNSKFVYVIFTGNHDHVVRFPCTPDADVQSVLKAVLVRPLPYPIDIAKAEIRVERPIGPMGSVTIVNAIDWHAISDEPDSESNLQLLPGDRVIVAAARGASERHERINAHVSTPQSAPVSERLIADIPDGASISDTVQHTFQGTNGSFTAKVPVFGFTVSPPAALDAENADLRVRIEVLSDTHDNLSEFWSKNTGNTLLADTDQMEASLRILKKNKIIEATQAPAVTCQSGQHITVDFGGTQLEITPFVANDASFSLSTKISQVYSEEIEASARLATGQTMVLRTSDESGVYVVLTPELVR